MRTASAASRRQNSRSETENLSAQRFGRGKALGSRVAQAQAVGHHEHRAERHGTGGDHGAQEAIGCEGNQRNVVEECPDQVLDDGLEGVTRQSDGPTHPAQVASDQSDASGGHGHIGSSTDGHAHVGLCERRSIVDAVPYHGHHGPHRATRRAPLLEAANKSRLLARQHSRPHLVDTHLGSYGLCGSRIVAGHHHHFQAELPQLGDGFPRPGLHGVGHRQRTNCT